MMKAKLKVKKSEFNPIYREKGLNNDNYFQIYFGGSSSGKSYFLSQRAVLDVMKGRNYLIVRKVKNTVRGSVFNEIRKSIISFGLSKYFSINKSEMTITCLINNRQIRFGGLDDVEKIKSITPIDGVFTDIWIEEATEITQNDFKQLKKRLRGQSKHKKRITISFNPIHKSHWIYKHFFGIWQDDKQYVKGMVDGLNCSILKTTYKDNEYLTEQDIANLENESDQYYYDVYTLGNWGVLGNLIFNNWKVKDLSDQMDKFNNIFYGLDWGFYPDPFAFVKMHIDERQNKIYIYDELYLYQRTNDTLIDEIKNKYNGGRKIVADSAEPKSIKYFKNNGVRIKAAEKGPGSIEYGIKRLKDYEIIIHKDCINTKNEFSLYKYKENKSGEVLPVPVDKNNHIIDSIRYATEELDHSKGIYSAYSS